MIILLKQDWSNGQICHGTKNAICKHPNCIFVMQKQLNPQTYSSKTIGASYPSHTP